MEPERHRIQTEFNKLRSILDKEEQRQLKKLEEEERKGLSILEEAENELVRQNQSLRELISDLEFRCQGSAVELLQVRLMRSPQSESHGKGRPAFLPFMHGVRDLVGARKRFIWPWSASCLLNRMEVMGKT